jgi:hypothetical protein
VFGGTGLSDDEDEGGDGEGGVITVKGPLEFLRHPQVKHTHIYTHVEGSGTTRVFDRPEQ